MSRGRRPAAGPPRDPTPANGREWHDPARVEGYLRHPAAELPWWRESESALLEHLPRRVTRFLDIGTGDGRLIALVRRAHPAAAAVGLDFSPPMLAAAARRFAGVPDVELIAHDLAHPLPPLGSFDLIVSGLAIHHLEDARKRSLYGEVHRLLRPGGRFLNLEHVSSATARLHREFMTRIGEAPEDEDPSDRCAPAWRQAEWLREVGFADADCHWKWREIALIGGRREAGPATVHGAPGPAGDGSPNAEGPAAARPSGRPGR
ncbi:MAG TPA: class I SAM-dependent methyltransferase [Miltoncostaeaceae bacterium]|nr:class I SAM-dependent methyltransferase [Miltoncostaeaceae bacterium]